jgi:cytosine/adenosine deaminase-related metal-dependent hydrolase
VIASLLLALALPVRADTSYKHFMALTDTASGPTIIRDGLLVVDEQGRIKSIGELTADVPGAVDLSGRWIIPGFLSGHTHLWQSAFRGLAADKTLVPWIKARVEIIKKDKLAKDDFFYFTQHGVVDLLENGITTIYSHAQALKGSESYAPEQFAAECALPQRFVYGVPAKDNTYDDLKKQLGTMHAASCPPLLGFGLSDAFLFASKVAAKERIQDHLKLQKEQGLLIEDHFLEEAEESKSERELYHKVVSDGYAPAWDKEIIAHFIHPDDAILDHVQKSGVSMIWNPLSNGRLGSGMPDIPGYLSRGVRVGMGVDGSASGDIADPFENMRMGLYGLRMITNHPEKLSPQQIFGLHTLGTAKVLGLDPKVGSLEAGKLADFLILDPHHPSVGGAAKDPWAQLVFAMSARNIESVVIGGKKAWDKGRSVGFDSDAIDAEAERRADKHIR